jgi:hypothetical protein
MFGFLVNKWVLGGLAGLLMLGFVYWKGYSHGKEVVQKEWNAQKVEDERIAQEWKDKVRETEHTWQAKADQIQKDQSRATKNITARYNALIDSLRDRPETRADGGMPEGADVTIGCTGEGLAKPDAEFLAGYAADAARLQAAYNSCQQAYEVIQNGAQ